MSLIFFTNLVKLMVRKYDNYLGTEGVSRLNESNSMFDHGLLFEKTKRSTPSIPNNKTFTYRYVVFLTTT